MGQTVTGDLLQVALSRCSCFSPEIVTLQLLHASFHLTHACKHVHRCRSLCTAAALQLLCITLAIAIEGFPTSRHVLYWVSQLHWKGDADCVAGRGGHKRHSATATYIFPAISGIPFLGMSCISWLGGCGADD